MTQVDKNPAPLDQQTIQNYFVNSGVEVEVHVLPQVDSTNTWLLQRKAAAPVTLCAAEHQTVGRGRRGKTWHSPDNGVTFSMRFDSAESICRFSGVSLLTGAVICDHLRAIGIANALMKWPNDILVDGSKLAGILVESRTIGSAGGTVLVLGIGINYQGGEEARLIDQATVDLAELSCGRSLPDRSQLIADIAIRLQQMVVGDVPQQLADLVANWSDYDALANASVMALAAEKKIHGRVVGIDGTGSLLLDTGDEVLTLNSAEVTVRKEV